MQEAERVTWSDKRLLLQIWIKLVCDIFAFAIFNGCVQDLLTGVHVSTFSISSGFSIVLCDAES